MAYMVEFVVSEPRYVPTILFPAHSSHYRRPPIGGMDRYDADKVPKVAFLTSAHPRIPEFVPIGGLAMIREARDLIESLEPAVHQFFPVEIARKRSTKPICRLDGSVLSEPYYLLHPQVMLDAVWVERSEVWIKEVPHYPPFVSPYPGNYKIILRKEITTSHHVWRGNYQMGNNLFFSDTLVDAINAKGWRKLKFSHLEES